MRCKLTEDVVSGVKPGRQYDIWDTVQLGLLVGVFVSGKSSYMVSLGRNRILTLAPTSKLTLKKARKLATVEQGKGEEARVTGAPDPIAERRREKASTLRTFRNPRETA
jgi:hypothetical protein